MNEAEIVRRCQQCDMAAYKAIWDRYGQPLLRTARHMLGQREDAEDAVQATFLKLCRSIGNFRFDAQFGTYLMRILLNTCFDTLKKRKKMKPGNIEEAEPAVAPNPELKIFLEGAIKELPRRMRACFVLFAVEGYKHKEIAAILNLSIGGVKANIYQAKQRLRAALSGPHFEESP